nr:PREDICTED: methyltransferase-like protein 9 [Bemisia tabaci]
MELPLSVEASGHNGQRSLLGRGSMFVFSTEHFKKLLNITSDAKFGSLLDIGAGDGATTERMAPFFEQVSTTEISPPMRWALAKKQFRVLELTDWAGHKFDVVTCLNVLDRCDSPLSLLEQMKRALNPGGVLIIALVLPYIPYVETNKSLAPSERLPLEGDTAEEQINGFAAFLSSLDLKIWRWTKMPYISEGDIEQAYYWLDDYIFLIAPTS